MTFYLIFISHTYGIHDLLMDSSTKPYHRMQSRCSKLFPKQKNFQLLFSKVSVCRTWFALIEYQRKNNFNWCSRQSKGQRIHYAKQIPRFMFVKKQILYSSDTLGGWQHIIGAKKEDNCIPLLMLLRSLLKFD